MANSLIREASVKLGPILLENLLRHYFDRIVKENASGDRVLTQLRKDELLYDEAFIVIKMFLEAASKHTVEEVQEFSNTRTPSPPWVHVVKVVVPMSCCDDAANIVIKALGGEELTKKLVGGTKWWQVRGIKGVDGQWIVSKKDWQEAKKRHEAYEKHRSNLGKGTSVPSTPPTGPEEEAFPPYEPNMDEMRCILYAHGGGYYFGSVDQERYAIQRFARKTNSRVFAINYRLAPQYPFPCALQDLIAAYLFLIRPPEGALHRPVNPAHIVVGGDSAGGGLTIALLQVLRDCDLPLPAGGILISPWCDLTHSFPSIHTNTPTDVIPPWGLSFQKPSTLWPPPPDEMTSRVREGLRSKIQDAIGLSRSSRNSSGMIPQPGEHDLRLPQTGQTLHLGSTASLPTIQSDEQDQTVQCTTTSGKVLRVEEQIHMYTPNRMLDHPLVSPVMSYLGGLPPLYVIAGDGEVLRDEIIFMAHKAANPAKFPIRPQTREIYPVLQGIEQRHGPTRVHLQVYDDAAHTLPILFSFTTPAKYCYRAIATFIRYVTTIPLAPTTDGFLDIPQTVSPPTTPGLDVPDAFVESTVSSRSQSPRPSLLLRPSSFRSSSRSRDPSPRPRGKTLFTSSAKKAEDDIRLSSSVSRRKSIRRAFSTHISRAGILFGANRKIPEASGSKELSETPRDSRMLASGPQRQPEQKSSSDVGGPRFYGSGVHEHSGDVRRAGEPSVYDDHIKVMIRERISTHGVIRPLEPEDQLSAFSLPPELVGVVSELAIRRYIDARTKFGKKFAKTYKTIEKSRNKHLATAKKNTMRNLIHLQNYLEQEKVEGGHGVADGLVTSGSWSWAWALDMDEKPPASSIVARRDTQEAVQLARIADQSVLAEESMMNANSLWTLMANFLTTTPGKKNRHRPERREITEGKESKENRVRSMFAQLTSDLKKGKDS